MIISRKHLDLDKRCVVEKLIVQTPLRYKRIFPDEACFLHFRNGNAAVSSANEKMDVGPSQSVLLKCGVYFADLIQDPAHERMEVLAIHLHADLLKEIYQYDAPPSFRPNNKTSFPQTFADSFPILHFVDGLNYYVDHPSRVTIDLLILKIKELILLLLHSEKAVSVSELISQLFTPRQAGLKEIIHTHLFSNLTIPELALLAGLSVSSFKREFQKVFHTTPANYIRAKRLDEAKRLLRHSDHSVSEICYRTGFGDPSNFTKVFKNQTGTSPIEFRNRR